MNEILTHKALSPFFLYNNCIIECQYNMQKCTKKQQKKT